MVDFYPSPLPICNCISICICINICSVFLYWLIIGSDCLSESFSASALRQEVVKQVINAVPRSDQARDDEDDKTDDDDDDGQSDHYDDDDGC